MGDADEVIQPDDYLRSVCYRVAISLIKEYGAERATQILEEHVRGLLDGSISDKGPSTMD